MWLELVMTELVWVDERTQGKSAFGERKCARRVEKYIEPKGIAKSQDVHTYVGSSSRSSVFCNLVLSFHPKPRLVQTNLELFFSQ